MKTQNYANHTRWVPGYHFLLSALLLAGLIISIANLVRHFSVNGLAVSLTLPLIFICFTMCYWYMRVFALKAQDRAIRAEESLRYLILTGKSIDSRITMGQIVALRFAPDAEFLALADKAAKEGLAPAEIKKLIKDWRADHHRA